MHLIRAERWPSVYRLGEADFSRGLAVTQAGGGHGLRPAPTSGPRRPPRPDRTSSFRYDSFRRFYFSYLSPENDCWFSWSIVCFKVLAFPFGCVCLLWWPLQDRGTREARASLLCDFSRTSSVTNSITPSSLRKPYGLGQSFSQGNPRKVHTDVTS